MAAIAVVNGIASIDETRCVECEVCVRTRICSRGALEPETDLEWPRSIRSIFSNPVSEYGATGCTGRGTEEMKTNDVTNRFGPGEVGIAIDVGRPNVGVRLREVDKLSRAVAAVGVSFEPANPLTALMVDEQAGILKDEILDEMVLSAIVEVKVPLEKVTDVLEAIRRVESDIRTVFTVGIICRVSDDCSVPVVPKLMQHGWTVRPNGKTNIGLGHC